LRYCQSINGAKLAFDLVVEPLLLATGVLEIAHDLAKAVEIVDLLEADGRGLGRARQDARQLPANRGAAASASGSLRPAGL
jgi:hypothetical protein